LADHYADTGDLSQSVAVDQDLLAKVRAANPDLTNDLRNATYLSTAYAAFARHLRRAGRLQDAMRWDTERRQLWQDWDRKLPKNAYIQRQLASSHTT
jgi:hypothetical protein